MPVCPAGTVTLVALLTRVKPLGTLAKLRLYVSAAGPVLRMTARNAVGT